MEDVVGEKDEFAELEDGVESKVIVDELYVIVVFLKCVEVVELLLSVSRVIEVVDEVYVTVVEFAEDVWDGMGGVNVTVEEDDILVEWETVSEEDINDDVFIVVLYEGEVEVLVEACVEDVIVASGFSEDGCEEDVEGNAVPVLGGEVKSIVDLGDSEVIVVSGS